MKTGQSRAPTAAHDRPKEHRHPEDERHETEEPARRENELSGLHTEQPRQHVPADPPNALPERRRVRGPVLIHEEPRRGKCERLVQLGRKAPEPGASDEQ
jgi:hypothetical protein